MTYNPKPVRRVVTGQNADGRSCVLYDSHAPLVRELGRGGKMTDAWAFQNCPTDLAGDKDEGTGPFVFETAGRGRTFAHCRFRAAGCARG